MSRKNPARANASIISGEIRRACSVAWARSRRVGTSSLAAETRRLNGGAPATGELRPGAVVSTGLTSRNSVACDIANTLNSRPPERGTLILGTQPVWRPMLGWNLPYERARFALQDLRR